MDLTFAAAGAAVGRWSVRRPWEEARACLRGSRTEPQDLVLAVVLLAVGGKLLWGVAS